MIADGSSWEFVRDMRPRSPLEDFVDDPVHSALIHEKQSQDADDPTHMRFVKELTGKCGSHSDHA